MTPLSRPSLPEISEALSATLDSPPWEGEQPLICFHDLERLSERMEAVSSSFTASSCRHTAAVKANPVMGVLRHLVKGGFGLECASWGEVELAMAAGCEPGSILFDSPAKTRPEIDAALEAGLHLNADNLDELERIGVADATRPARSGSRTSRVGLRVNPQVGDGTIATTSVAGRESKFGVPLDSRRSIVEAFLSYDFLDGVHMHVGSQGVSLESLLDAADRLRELVAEISAAGGSVRWVDIGGGLPVRYTDADEPFDIGEYTSALAKSWPELGHEYMLLTELGRWLQANVGYVAARVEYVKDVGEGQTLISHAGADLFMRPVYQPENWAHEYALLDKGGAPRSGTGIRTKLAGPLCFGGDVIAASVSLPAANEGDWLIVRDTGAYTLSMWSRHCSRTMPPVMGVDTAGVHLLKAPESVEQLRALWS